LFLLSHDERRYAINNINERWKQNKSYFGPLFAEVENGGVGAMLYDLLKMDLEGWHPREEIPQTAALVEQKMLSLEGPEQWWVNMLGNGQHPRADAKFSKPVFKLRTFELPDPVDPGEPDGAGLGKRRENPAPFLAVGFVLTAHFAQEPTKLRFGEVAVTWAVVLTVFEQGAGQDPPGIALLCSGRIKDGEN
jgi:hypothetical protein